MTSEIRNKTYSQVQDEIDALEVSKKEKVLAILLAAITALLLIAGPIAAFVNLLIFTNYQYLYAFFIAIFVIIGLFLGDYLYLHLITKNKVEGLYHVWAMDIIILSIVVLIVYFVLTKILF